MLRTKHSLRHTLYALNLPYLFYFIPLFTVFKMHWYRTAYRAPSSQLPCQVATDKGYLPGDESGSQTGITEE